jgi:hypothetical protein
VRQLTLQELRDTLEGTLTRWGVPLGTYTLPGGAQAPALWVGDVPEGTTVTGLEVLIPATPEQDVIQVMAGVITIDRYPVRLVSHDGQPLKTALNAVYHAFRTVTDVNALPATSDYPEQVVVTITP